jgi:ubiquinone/menaquinone biosynthesis C-methylase UbiE
MSVEQQVSTHYTAGNLERKILGALRNAGKDPAHLSSDDIAPLDNFHLGGRQAISDLASFMHLSRGMHLLDVGCGVGGPARYFAEQGCQVTGLDLTAEFVQVAESLTRMLKLEGQAKFRQGSALEMPYPPDTFDGAYMIHVGMNIEDKAGVFREVARVVKRGGRFSIFDIMQTGNGPLEFPLPWAVGPETSFVRTTEGYRKALEAAGFRVEHERGRHQFALEEMEKRMSRGPSGAPPVIGVHILMGEKAPVMLKNVNEAIVSGKLEPVEIVAVAGER